MFYTSKIKHNTLWIRFHQVENIKSITIIFNSIANALRRMGIPLTDRKV